MKNDRPIIIAFLAVIFLVAVATVALLKFGFTALASAIIGGFTASFLYILIGYLSIRKAFAKPAVKFYRLFFGGLAVRFLLFIMTLVLIHRFVNIPIFGFILSFIGFYIVFQILEMHFIWQKLEKRTNTH